MLGLTEAAEMTGLAELAEAAGMTGSAESTEAAELVLVLNKNASSQLKRYNISTLFILPILGPIRDRK